MAKYLLKRVAFLLLTFLVITYLLFAVYCLVPGNPIMYKYSNDEDPEVSEFAIIVKLVTVNYLRWMGFIGYDGEQPSGLLQGYFGFSYYYGKESLASIRFPLVNTLALNTLVTVTTLLITIPLGIFCAVHYKQKSDTFIQTFTLLGTSLPLYILCLISIFVFAVTLGIFPAGGIKTPGALYTGLRAILDRLYYMALPALTLIFSGMASLTRTVRAAMVDTLSQDYIKTARAKGLREKVVIYSHAWRNALLPISASLCQWIIGMYTGGSLIIETYFALNGIGSTFWNALSSSDFELVLCFEVIYTSISLIGKLITDIVYTLTDPRVKFC